MQVDLLSLFRPSVLPLPEWSQNQNARLPEYDKLLGNVEYAIRPDGIFFFQIDWDPTDFETGEYQELRRTISHIVSGLIKEQEGHRHIFDKDRVSQRLIKHEAGFPTISNDPIKIRGNFQFPFILKALSDDAKLCRFRAVSRSERRPRPECALIVLRAQFAKCFDQAQNIRVDIQQKSVTIPKLGRKIKVYDYRPYALLFVISVFFLLIYDLMTNRISFETGNQVKPHATEIKINLTSIVSQFWDYSAILAIPFVIMIYIISISAKRRKILKAISKAKGFLLFGNIFNANLKCIFERCDDKRKFIPDFSDSIEILNEIEVLEKKKRVQTQFMLGVIFLASFSRFKSEIDAMYPDFDKIVPVFSIISVFIPGI